MLDRIHARSRRNGCQRGFSLGELLVVLAVIGIAAVVAVPLVSEQIRKVKVRAAADQFAMSLKAARHIAVSKRTDVAVNVQAHPTNTYSYTDTTGRLRQIRLPDGVRIIATTNPITFRLNGSLASAASTVLEADMTAGDVERWRINTSILGVPTIEHKRTSGS